MVEKDFEGFDRVFPLIGGHHIYQWLLLLIVSYQRGVGTLHHIGYIFLGASPPHWCSVDELLVNSGVHGWTPEQVKNISIPHVISNSDSRTIKYAECEYYDLPYEELLLLNFEDAYASIDFQNVETKECTSWSYDQSIYESTVVTQFDLVCERRGLVPTIQATYMSGIFVGSLVLGALSDKILGRRRTTLLSIFLIITFGLGTAYASSYLAFIIFRFMIAIGVAGSSQNCFTILMEYSDTRCRATLGLITQVSFAAFYMLLPLYAYFIRDWVQLQLSFFVTTLSLIVYYWLLPESSRWLAQNGREEEALDILEGIAKKNKREPPPNRTELKKVILESCVDQSSSSSGRGRRAAEAVAVAEAERRMESQGVVYRRLVLVWQGFKKFLSSYANLVKTPELRKRSFLIWFLYMTVSFTYYGVSFGSPALSADPFIIVFLGGLMEIPGYVGVVPFVSYWGRKPTTIATFLIAGLSYLAILFTPIEYTALRITFAMVSKLFISGCLAIIILLASELYPTEARSTGFGSAVLMGRIGAISAPFLVRMKFEYEQMPTLIIGANAILAGLVSFLLPETKDDEMFEKVDTIEHVVQRRRSEGSLRKSFTLGAASAGATVAANHDEEQLRAKRISETKT